MAENESLDLGNPGAQRWKQVHDAVRKGQPVENVANKVERTLPAALRKAFKEFAEKGVSFKEFLANRDDPGALLRLVRKCQGHEYAHLFVETTAAEPASDDRRLVAAYLDGIIERVTDQIAQTVAGTRQWPSFPDIRHYLGQVKQQVQPDVQRIADKLADDPTSKPTARRSKKGERTDPTKEMMDMSLLGMTKK